MPLRTDALAAAVGDLGDPTKLGYCVQQGAHPWALAAKLPYPDYSDGNGHSTTNVTDLVEAARKGLAGWKVIPARDALPGDFLIWPNYDHITIYVDNKPGGFRSIGAGGPTGRVAYQPQGGATGNPASYFLCALRPPYTEPVKPSVESDKDFVRRVARYLNNRLGGLDTTAVTDGVRGKVYWTLVQTAGQKDGLYGKGYDIDGVPGPKTYELEKHYGRIA
jgi:hypothetical protein